VSAHPGKQPRLTLKDAALDHDRIAGLQPKPRRQLNQAIALARREASTTSSPMQVGSPPLL
jgi:hypothetical protein